jgi:hypothetical protein
MIPTTLSYAGIGSRETPVKFLLAFVEIAETLANNGVILRSGGASGADSAFEMGCKKVQGKMEIYLPWKGFNENESHLFGVTPEAMELAQKFHPKWDKLSDKGKLLIARNGYQVLGESLKNPVDFIMCWTKEGKVTGGTGQALRIAKHYNIPVYNFGKKDFDKGWIDDILTRITTFKLFI